MTRKFSTRDDGVSTIIGAILVAGLLVTALVTVQVSFVPVWQKDSESGRLVAVEGQLSKMISDIERQVDNRSSTSLAHPMQLGQRGSGLFAGTPLADTVRLQSVQRSYKTDANELLLLQGNGVNFAGLNPAWTSIPTTTTVTDIIRVDALRLRVDHIDVNDDGDFVELTINDATSALVGKFRLEVIDPTGSGSSFYITVSTTDGSGNTVTSVTYSHHQQVEFTPYYEDALNAVYLFDQLIASATVPLSLSIQHSVGFGADYNIAYVESGPGGLPVLIGSSGILRVPYTATYSGVSFTYDVSTRRMPPATYVYEHGALILEQNEGAAFKLPPAFTVERANDITSLAFNIPTLAGDSFAKSGTANAVLVTKASDHSDIVANAPRFFLSIETDYPELWADFLRTALTDAGLEENLGGDDFDQFQIPSDTANPLVVEIYGANALQGDTSDYDLSIVLQQATITLSTES